MAERPHKKAINAIRFSMSEPYVPEGGSSGSDSEEDTRLRRSVRQRSKARSRVEALQMMNAVRKEASRSKAKSGKGVGVQPRHFVKTLSSKAKSGEGANTKPRQTKELEKPMEKREQPPRVLCSWTSRSMASPSVHLWTLEPPTSLWPARRWKDWACP